MTDYEYLTKAAELISDPAHWCKGAEKLCFPDGSIFWCSLGALSQIGTDAKLSDLQRLRAERILDDSWQELGFYTVEGNDSHPHTVALDRMHRAAQIAKERESQ